MVIKYIDPFFKQAKPAKLKILLAPNRFFRPCQIPKVSRKKRVLTQLRHQFFGSCHLKPEYLPEAVSLTLLNKFNIFDKNGNSLALYKDDYLILRDRIRSLYKIAPMDLQDPAQLMSLISELQLKIIRYYSLKNLSLLQLDIDYFNQFDEMRTLNGIFAIKGNHQNCVVLRDGNIYMHPKVRSNPQLLEDGYGVSHTSLGGTQAVCPCSLRYDNHRWILENTTGHFGTRITQMRFILKVMSDKGLDLERLTLQLWVPRDYKSLDLAGYEIFEENALYFMERMEKMTQFTPKKHFGVKF